MKQVLSTGVIRSPHGVKGYVKVQPFSDDIKHFHDLKSVKLSKMDKTKDVEVEDVQVMNGQPLMKFKGIDSPEDARFFSGWEILVPRNQASRLGKGMVYIADLPGMRLIYDNEEVGEVISVAEGSQAPILEVQNKEGKLFMVPYLKGKFVEAADLEENTIKLLIKELVQ